MASIQYRTILMGERQFSVWRKRQQLCHVAGTGVNYEWIAISPNFGKTCNSKVKCESAIFRPSHIFVFARTNKKVIKFVRLCAKFAMTTFIFFSCVWMNLKTRKFIKWFGFFHFTSAFGWVNLKLFFFLFENDYVFLTRNFYWFAFELEFIHHFCMTLFISCESNNLSFLIGKQNTLIQVIRRYQHLINKKKHI